MATGSSPVLTFVGTWPMTAHLDVSGCRRVLFYTARPTTTAGFHEADTGAASRLHRSTRLVVCGHTHMQFDG